MKKSDSTYQALLASDDAEFPTVMRAILLSAGIRMHTVRKNELAYEAERQYYTLIVIDGDLPVAIHADETVVVAVSPADVVMAYDMGADLVINRPMVSNVFLAKVRSVLRRFGYNQ